MNPMKKQTKLAIGISIIALSIALIAAIIIFALNTLTKSTVLYGKVHNAVYPTVVDGVFISNYKGDYVLVRGDDIISGRYTFLAPTEDVGKYYFSDNNGNWGIVENSGKEIKKVKSNGNALQTDVFEFFLESRGTACYYDESKHALIKIEGDEVYSYDRFNKIGGARERDLPSGLVYYKKANNFYLGSFYHPGLTISCGEFGATFSASTVSFLGESGAVTYDLVSFEKVEKLNGCAPTPNDSSYILTDSASKMVVRIDNTDGIYEAVVDGKRIKTSLIKPSIAMIGSDGCILAEDSLSGNKYEYIDFVLGVASGVTTDFNLLRTIDYSFYRVGDKILNANFSEIATNALGEANVSKLSKNTIIVGGKVMQSTDGATLTLKLSDAYEVEGYYISEGRNVYNSSFNLVFSAEGVEFVDSGLFKSGKTYINGNGKKIENVTKNIRTIKYSDASKNGAQLGEWAFLTTDGAIVSFTDLGISAENVAKVGDVFKIFELSGTFLAVGTKGVVNKGGDFESIGGIKDAAIFTKERIVLTNENAVLTIEANETDIRRLDAYMSYNCSIISANRYGVVFSGGVDLQGIIGVNGKVLIKPMYKSITLQNNFAVAETNFGTTRFGLINLSGKAISDFEFVEDGGGFGLLLNDSVIVKKSNGTYAFVNNIGKEVLKNITGYDSLKAFKFDSETGKYIPDTDLYYALYIGEGIRILKYPSVFTLGL